MITPVQMGISVQIVIGFICAVFCAELTTVDPLHARQDRSHRLR
jgi:hypothetical protein